MMTGAKEHMVLCCLPLTQTFKPSREKFSLWNTLDPSKYKTMNQKTTDVIWLHHPLYLSGTQRHACKAKQMFPNAQQGGDVLRQRGAAGSVPAHLCCGGDRERWATCASCWGASSSPCAAFLHPNLLGAPKGEKGKKGDPIQSRGGGWSEAKARSPDGPSSPTCFSSAGRIDASGAGEGGMPGSGERKEERRGREVRDGFVCPPPSGPGASPGLSSLLL